MQSDDLFVRKFRRQSPRPTLASVTFEPKRESVGLRTRVVAEWPPRRDEDSVGVEVVTPSRVGPGLRSGARGHVMQRSNSDVTLGDMEASGKVAGKVIGTGGRKADLEGHSNEDIGLSDDSGRVLHREYGSLSSLERRMHSRVVNSDEQGALSPSALRFKDPLLLLGLPGPEPELEHEADKFFRALSAPEGDSKTVKSVKLEPQNKKAKTSSSPQLYHVCPGDSLGGGTWVRNFAHYDVQSILFDLTKAVSSRDSIGRKKNITSGASAASQLCPPAASTPPLQAGGGVGDEEDSEGLRETVLPDEGDGNDNDMLLSCPHFRNETGGEERAGLGRTRGPGGLRLSLRSPNDAVSVLEEPRESSVQQQGKSNYFIEYADLGAHFYRKYFYMKDHQNFFGVDERLGPVAISFRREEKEVSSGVQYNYRIIFRTTELKTLRGSILEESVPSAARHTTPRGLSPKRLLEHIIPELNLHCLRLASNSPKVRDTLLKLDEQGLNFQRKVGVMYCRASQSSEEDMYNNESAGPAFEEFLDLLGERVRLLGFDKYRAQLDIKSDSTGTHSLYTRYQDYEIMFHVSTMLPYTPNNTQQLLRKRHIGNDIVTIVFQEPGSLPFTPKTIRSHFQHVFIIVQVHHPCTDHTYYRVAVTRSKDIPLFGPLFPKGARFPRSAAFRDFLLAKAVNAENAAEKSEKFLSMATRTRQEYLKDLAENYVTTTPIESSTKFPLLSLGAKRKDKLKGAKGAELYSAGALVWAVLAAEGHASVEKFPCLLGISAESVVLIGRSSRQVVFNCSCRDVIGWKAVMEGGANGGPCLDIFYEQGDWVSISVPDSQMDDIREVVQRLELVTRGCEAREITALRDCVGQPGFSLNEEGFVVDLQRHGYVEKAGLQLWARVVQLCGRSLVDMLQDERACLLRTASRIQLTVIPPDEKGKPRRSFSELYQKAMQDTEHKAEDGQCGEAWILEEKEERGDGEGKAAQPAEEPKRRDVPPGTSEEAECQYSLVSFPGLLPLRASSQQQYPAGLIPENRITVPVSSVLLDRPVYDNRAEMKDKCIYENALVLRDTTPDLILAVKPKAGVHEENWQKPFGTLEAHEDQPSATEVSHPLSPAVSLEAGDRSSRALNLHNSITKILSETTDSTEEEWQSISDLATACRSVLEALSHDDPISGDGAQAAGDSAATVVQMDSKLKDVPQSDTRSHLEEKVSQLESMLKRLQEDLQKEKEDKAMLQAEVQSLRQNNQRLQEESQSTVARLIKVTELLCSVNKPC
ncbi:signal-induced proliferation-associated protein 1 isoform X1 [Arapaima gigas]